MKPRDYQIEAAVWLWAHKGGIIGDQVGLGKTLTSLLGVKELGGKRNLIISPKSLKPWWEKEIKNFMGEDTTVSYTPKDKAKFTLAHYEQFQGRNEPKTLTKELIKNKWDCVVVDECHHLSNRKSQRTKWIKKLICKYKIGVTGTPIREKPDNLWSLLNWLDKKHYSSYWRFVSQYCETKAVSFKGRNFTKVIGVKNKKLFSEEVSPYLLVRHRKDVGIELPPLTTTKIPLVMEDDQKKFYKEVKNKTVVELKEKINQLVWDLSEEDQLIIRAAIARFTRLQQVVSDPTVFKDGVSSCKLDWLKEYTGQQGVILTRFKHTVNKVQAVVSDKDFVVGTYAKLGEGHNLQRYSVLIAWDAPQSRKDWEQAVGRIRRLGQSQPQQIYQLVVGDTIENRAWGLIESKQAEIDLILEWLRDIQ